MVSRSHPGVDEKEGRDQRRYAGKTDRNLRWNDQRERKAPDRPRHKVHLRHRQGRVVFGYTLIVLVLILIPARDRKKVCVH